MAKNDEVYYTPAGSPVIPDRFDVRVRLRHLSKGALSFEEVKKHLSSLPDDSAHADYRNYDSVVREEATESAGEQDITH